MRVYEENKMPTIEEILQKKSARLLRNPLEIPFKNDYGGMLQSKSSNYRILESKFRDLDSIISKRTSQQG